MDALGFTPELDSKTLLLKTVGSRVTVHGAIKLVWTWKLHLYWLLSQCSKVLCLLPEKKSNPQSYLTVTL